MAQRAEKHSRKKFKVERSLVYLPSQDICFLKSGKKCGLTVIKTQEAYLVSCYSFARKDYFLQKSGVIINNSCN